MVCLIKPFMIKLLRRKEHRQFLGVPLGAIHAQALQFQRLHRGNIQTDGEGQLRRMHAKGELRGHLGWNGDIITSGVSILQTIQ